MTLVVGRNRHGRPNARTALIALVLALPAVRAMAQRQQQARRCGYEVNGIDHCAIGTARLAVIGEALVVRMAGRGADGVHSSFSGARDWSVTRLPIDTSSEWSLLTLHALIGDVVASSADINYGPREQAYRLTFSHHRYDARVFLDGKLVGQATNLPSGSIGATTHRRWRGGQPGVTDGGDDEDFDSEDHDQELHPAEEEDGFRITSQGSCAWRFSLHAPVPFVLPGGQVVTGDSVEFVEGAHDHHGIEAFTGIRMQGTLEVLVLTDERTNG